MKPYGDWSDAELLTLLSEGDNHAFEAIYRRYASPLYHYARKSISVGEECEEIVQEIFESLWTRRAVLTHVTLLDAYLYSMVKYKVVRYFRRAEVKKRYEEHYKLFEAIYDSSLEEDRNANMLQTLIDRQIATLPERCQQAIRLRLDENLSNGDIADRMKIKKTTVENYFVSAIDHLRTTFKGSRRPETPPLPEQRNEIPCYPDL